MIVTDKKFFMEKRLVEKLDLLIKRMEGTDDNVILVDGDEGQGKTNLTVGICYYTAYKTGRTYNAKENIFFDLEELINYASTTKEKIIHWDEGALGGMSQHWWNKNQQKFIQLLMVARKKKHFIVICIPRFYKLNEYLVVDRSIALIHVYSRKNIQKGRFCYYNKKAKERLMEDWRRRHVKNYRKHKTFWGNFLEYMDRHVFDEEQLKEYDKKKDAAIASIAQDNSTRASPDKIELRKFKNKIGKLKFPINTKKELCLQLEIDNKTLLNWSKINQKVPKERDVIQEKGIQTGNNNLGYKVDILPPQPRKIGTLLKNV